MWNHYLETSKKILADPGAKFLTDDVLGSTIMSDPPISASNSEPLSHTLEQALEDSLSDLEQLVLGQTSGQELFSITNEEVDLAAEMILQEDIHDNSTFDLDVVFLDHCYSLMPPDWMKSPKAKKEQAFTENTTSETKIDDQTLLATPSPIRRSQRQIERSERERLEKIKADNVEVHHQDKQQVEHKDDQQPAPEPDIDHCETPGNKTVDVSSPNKKSGKGQKTLNQEPLHCSDTMGLKVMGAEKKEEKSPHSKKQESVLNDVKGSPAKKVDGRKKSVSKTLGEIKNKGMVVKRKAVRGQGKEANENEKTKNVNQENDRRKNKGSKEDIKHKNRRNSSKEPRLMLSECEVDNVKTLKDKQVVVQQAKKIRNGSDNQKDKEAANTDSHKAPEEGTDPLNIKRSLKKEPPKKHFRRESRLSVEVCEPALFSNPDVIIKDKGLLLDDTTGGKKDDGAEKVVDLMPIQDIGTSLQDSTDPKSIYFASTPITETPIMEPPSAKLDEMELIREAIASQLLKPEKIGQEVPQLKTILPEGKGQTEAVTAHSKVVSQIAGLAPGLEPVSSAKAKPKPEERRPKIQKSKERSDALKTKKAASDKSCSGTVVKKGKSVLHRVSFADSSMAKLQSQLKTIARPKRAKKRKHPQDDNFVRDIDTLGNEEDDIAYSDDLGDSDWSSEDDPEKLWCICRRPHNDRFMIQCDRCQDWFHGTCVGVTRQQGRQMEKASREWWCPKCNKGDKESSRDGGNNPLAVAVHKKDAVKPKLTSHKDDRNLVQKVIKDDVSNLQKVMKEEGTNLQKASKEEGSSMRKMNIEDGYIVQKVSRDDGTIVQKMNKEDGSVVRKASKEEGSTVCKMIKEEGSTARKMIKEEGSTVRKVIKEEGSTVRKVIKEEGSIVCKAIKEEGSIARKVVKDEGSTARKMIKEEGSIARKIIKEEGSTVRKVSKEEGSSVRKVSKDEGNVMQKTIRVDGSMVQKVNKEDGSFVHKASKEDWSVLRKVSKEDGSHVRKLIESQRPKVTSLHMVQDNTMHKTEKKKDVVIPQSDVGHVITEAAYPEEPIPVDTTKPSSEVLKSKALSPASVGVSTQENLTKGTILQKDKIEGSDIKTSTSKVKLSTSEPDPVRLSVRKSLRDILISRCKDAEDITTQPDDIKKIALRIEEQLFKLFKDTGLKYKAKYRSLMFNIKDLRNQLLFRKILKNRIPPEKLVRMSPEELATKELARWRERENQHMLDMIKKEQLEQQQQGSHVIKKTHKGEVEVEEEDLRVLEHAESQLAKGPIDDAETGPIDTTESHHNHLFDMNCKICIGKIAPPKEEGGQVKKVRVAHTVLIEAGNPDFKTTDLVAPRVSLTEEDEAEGSGEEAPMATTADDDDDDDDSIQENPPSEPKDSSTPPAVSVRSPDPVPKEQDDDDDEGNTTPPRPISVIPVWKGFIFMQDITKFATNAYEVSGSADFLTQDIPGGIEVCGRIIPEQVWEYLSKIKQSGNKELVIIRFQAVNDEEKLAYSSFYSYLSTRKRYGVVGNSAQMIKDFYILPLASHCPVPTVLMPFDGPGLDATRSHLLLGVIVKHKSRLREPSVPHRSSAATEMYEPSYTPPLENLLSSQRSSSKCASVDDSEAYEPSYTPPLENLPKTEIDTIGSPASPCSSSNMVDDKLDKPYDPEDNDLDYGVNQDSASSSKTQQVDISTSNIGGLLDQISKTASPLFVPQSLASAGTTTELERQKQLLIEITRKVEEQRQAVEQQKHTFGFAGETTESGRIFAAPTSQFTSQPLSMPASLPASVLSNVSLSSLESVMSSIKNATSSLAPCNQTDATAQVKRLRYDTDLPGTNVAGKRPLLQDPIVQTYGSTAEAVEQRYEDTEVELSYRGYAEKKEEETLVGDRYGSSALQDLGKRALDPRLKTRTPQQEANVSVKSTLSAMSASELLEKARRQLEEMEAQEVSQATMQQESQPSLSTSKRPPLLQCEPPPPGVESNPMGVSMPPPEMGYATSVSHHPQIHTNPSVLTSYPAQSYSYPETQSSPPALHTTNYPHHSSSSYTDTTAIQPNQSIAVIHRGSRQYPEGDSDQWGRWDDPQSNRGCWDDATTQSWSHPQRQHYEATPAADWREGREGREGSERWRDRNRRWRGKGGRWQRNRTFGKWEKPRWKHGRKSNME